MTRQSQKLFITVILGLILVSSTVAIIFFIYSSPKYKATPAWLTESTEFTRIEWQDLLPSDEKAVLEKYRAQGQMQAPRTVDDFSSQILSSLEAATDSSYQEALISTNTVAALDGMPVSIAAFIVPIDYHESQDPMNIFIVPYFGACLHFPPPPPNQMLFARLEDGFSEFDITQAYRIEGKIKIQMFEDIIGTSAYSIEITNISPYQGEPDTFRQHDIQ